MSLDDPTGALHTGKSYDNFVPWQTFYTQYTALVSEIQITFQNEDIPEPGYIWLIPSLSVTSPIGNNANFDDICVLPRIRYKYFDSFSPGRNLRRIHLNGKLYVKEFISKNVTDFDYPADVTSTLASSVMLKEIFWHFGITGMRTQAFTVDKQSNVLIRMTMLCSLSDRKTLADPI